MEVPQTHSNQPHRPSNPPQIDQALIGIINIIHTHTTFLKEWGGIKESVLLITECY